MSKTHTLREKRQAVFLAALMVLSVFAMSAAFAGGAAADHGQDEHTLTLTVQDSDGANVPEGTEVTINEQTETVSSGQVTFDLAEGDYLVEVAGVANHYDSTFSVSMPNADSSETLELISEDEESQTTLSQDSQSTHFQGVDLVIDDQNIDPTAEYDIREYDGSEAGEFVTQITPNDQGNLEINTDELEGRYVVEVDGTQYPFEVAEQSLDTEWDSESVVQNEEASLEIDSNRGSYATNITADNLDSEELVRMFQGDVVGIDDNTVRVVETEDVSIDAGFTNVDAGDHTFTTSVTDTTAESEASITVEEPADADASFDSSTYSEEAGDVVEFTVDMENTDSTVVTIEDDNGNYWTDLLVTAGEDEDEVTVRFNTYNASQGAAADSPTDDQIFSTESDENDVQIIDESEFDTETEDGVEVSQFRLLSGSFDLDLYMSDDTQTSQVERLADNDDDVETGDDNAQRAYTDDLEQVDVATLNLNEGSTTDVSTGVAPASADLDSDTSVEDLRNATTDGSDVAQNDYLVVAVESSGIFGFLEDGDFGDEITLNVEQTNPAQYQSANELNHEDAELVKDDENNRLYFIFDTSENGIEEGAEYDVTFSVTDSYDYIDDNEDEESTTSFNVVERAIEVTGDFDDEDRLQVENSDEANITGESTAAPGTDVNVRLDASGENPFFLTQMVEVQEDGTIDAAYNLSDYEAGQNFTVRMTDQFDNDVQTEVDATLVESEGNPHSVTVTVEDADGNAVSGADVSVADQTETTDDDGQVTFELWHGEYDVTATHDGEETTGTLTINDKDNTTDEGTLVLGEENENINDGDDQSQDDQQGQDQEPGDDNQNQGSDGSNGDGDDGDSEDQPGFGIAVALIALLAAAGIAVRNRA